MTKNKKALTEWSEGELLERLKELIKSEPIRETASLFAELNRRGIRVSLNMAKIRDTAQGNLNRKEDRRV